MSFEHGELDSVIGMSVELENAGVIHNDTILNVHNLHAYISHINMFIVVIMKMYDEYANQYQKFGTPKNWDRHEPLPLMFDHKFME